MRIICCNSADGFHGISACGWHTVELLNRLDILGERLTSRTKLYDKRDYLNSPIVNIVLDKRLLLTRKLLNQGFLVVKSKSSLRTFYGRHNHLVNRYEVSVSQMTTYVFSLS